MCRGVFDVNASSAFAVGGKRKLKQLPANMIIDNNDSGVSAAPYLFPRHQ
jgi:hypothetical protein